MANTVKKPDMVISPHVIQRGKSQAGQKGGAKDASFDRLLEREVKRQSGLHFSTHATKRLESRNIHLTPQQQQRLQEAVDAAESKGVKDSLILLNRLAFVVNIKNRTVITAMDQSQMQEKGIFTNIDGAMILPDDE